AYLARSLQSAFRGRTAFHLPAVAFRFRHPGFAVAFSYLGAIGLRLGSDRHGHAPRRRAEEIRTLRPYSHRPAAAAGRGANMDAAARLALPGKPGLLRLGRDAPERTQL